MFVCCAVLWTGWAASQDAMPEKGDAGGDCSPCHSSKNPSRNDLYTPRCLRHGKTDAAKPQSDAAAPDVFILDQLSDIYVPVVFPHKLHASMENMSEGCGVCHHHSESGKSQRCRECHSPGANEENLSQPGLKGAYHRQCLGCHREWSHDTNCVVCHAKRDPLKKFEPVAGSADIMGRLHPNVEVPVKRVYQTAAMEEGTLVTFHHKEHVELFGHRCVDCHKKENCSRCHDTLTPAKHEREDPHEDCTKCHDVSDNCGACHMKSETQGFDHGRRSSFMLKAYHQEVSCQKCHKKAGAFKGLNKECQSCHPASWFPAAFDHAKTGLVLDSDHADTACNGCHPVGLGNSSSCSSCHDDNRKYPEKSPGKGKKVASNQQTPQPNPPSPQPAAQVQ